MAAARKSNVWERRLREIEREKADVRAQLAAVRSRMDFASDDIRMPREPRVRGAALPDGYRVEPVPDAVAPLAAGVMERDAADAPEGEVSLDFAPGPEGLDTKRVVMPRLQRTDLLRPAIGGTAGPTRLMEPEHDRFRNYFGTAGLKRVREARKEQGSQRIRAIFMILMVLTLGFILFQMVT